MHHPDLADLIDGSIGEGSLFHERFGYYAQGVGPETAVLPQRWQQRMVKVQNENTDLKVGRCLEPHDLAVAKLVANRAKDKPFVGAMLNAGIISGDTLVGRLAQTAISPARREKLIAWVLAETKAGTPPLS